MELIILTKDALQCSRHFPLKIYQSSLLLLLVKLCFKIFNCHNEIIKNIRIFQSRLSVFAPFSRLMFTNTKPQVVLP